MLHDTTRVLTKLLPPTSYTSRNRRSNSLRDDALRRINPVPESQRVDPRLYQVFFAWFAASANVLTFGAGSVGPAAFGLGMKASFLTIMVTDIMYVFEVLSVSHLMTDMPYSVCVFPAIL